jgi:hypothetical protein
MSTSFVAVFPRIVLLKGQPGYAEKAVSHPFKQAGGCKSVSAHSERLCGKVILYCSASDDQQHLCMLFNGLIEQVQDAFTLSLKKTAVKISSGGISKNTSPNFI